MEKNGHRTGMSMKRNRYEEERVWESNGHEKERV
jgi:hypothetical protein